MMVMCLYILKNKVFTNTWKSQYTNKLHKYNMSYGQTVWFIDQTYQETVCISILYYRQCNDPVNTQVSICIPRPDPQAYT